MESSSAVDFITPYGREGPSSRVRVFEWLDRIDEEVRLSSYVDHRNAAPSYLLRHPRHVAVAERRLRRIASHPSPCLLLHREASPLSRGRLERRLLVRASYSIYDFDDALQWDTGAGGLYRRWAPKSRKALIGVQGADRVIAGNRVLADWATDYNDDVVVIPSCVAHENYRVKNDYSVGDPPRLGWVGSADNEVYLQLVGDALRQVHGRTGARLTLIGTTIPRLGELEDMIDRIAWSESAQHERIAEFDVGLAPVPDEPYERGKCGYKILQYAAAGVPSVGSPIGVNRDILAQLEMPAPESTEEWVESILGLLGRSQAAREAAGRAARDVVQEFFSFESWLPHWRAAVGLPASEPVSTSDAMDSAR